MLISYKVGNFCSFDDVAIFDLNASSTKVVKRFSENYYEDVSGYNLLKTALIVGENAGGKSNFVKSIDYFKSLFETTDEICSHPVLVNANNVTDCPVEGNTEQSFEIEWLANSGRIYKYSLCFGHEGISREAFLYADNKKNAYKSILNVEIRYDEISCLKNGEECDRSSCTDVDRSANVKYQVSCDGNDMVDKDFERIISTRINSHSIKGLFITMLAMLGDDKAIEFIDEIKKKLYAESNYFNYGIYKSITKESEDLEIIRDPRFFEIFRLVDYSIKSIEIDSEEPFRKTLVYREKKDGTVFSRQLMQESSGVMEFFAWATQIYKVIYKNCTVIADEVDRVINPVLSDRILSFVNGSEHSGQFIFTTHNILHLDLKKYMKEQIYFITKDVDTLNSELYSLSDFSDIRYENSKVYELYVKGILGATVNE